MPLDVTLLNVSEPDEDGYCSYGISADLAFSAAECSKTIVAQVNKYMPRTFGDPVIHVSKIDAMVRGDEPLVEVPTVSRRHSMEVSCMKENRRYEFPRTK